MNKEKLVKGLKEMLDIYPDEIINGKGFYHFSSDEIKMIIRILEKEDRLSGWEHEGVSHHGRDGDW